MTEATRDVMSAVCVVRVVRLRWGRCKRGGGAVSDGAGRLEEARVGRSRDSRQSEPSLSGLLVRWSSVFWSSVFAPLTALSLPVLPVVSAAPPVSGSESRKHHVDSVCVSGPRARARAHGC
jgi:hypothetical protein